MMFEGKHIHFSPINKKPLCSYSAKLCKQRRINGYAFCIRHILEDKSAPFKQCAHVARYNKQKCTNPIPSNENREFCNSHMQVAGILPKKERKIKKEKEKELLIPVESKLKFSDRLKALLIKENNVSCNEDTFNSDDPYAFPDPVSENENGSIGFSTTPFLRTVFNNTPKTGADIVSMDSPSRCDQISKNTSADNKLKSNTPKLSKTMNRLQAKIAQNKLLDKQKKTQDASQVTLALTNANINVLDSSKTEPLSPVVITNTAIESVESKAECETVKAEIEDFKMELSEENTKSEDSIVSNSIPSPNPPSVSQVDSHQSSGLNSCSSSDRFYCSRDRSPVTSDISSKDKSHLSCEKELTKYEPIQEKCNFPDVLEKMHRIFKNRKKKKKDILPFGVDTSESESSDSEDESNLLNQLSWFCAWDRRSSSCIQNMQYESRSVRHLQLKAEFQRSYQQLCRLRSLHKREIVCQQEIVKPLIEAAYTYPDKVSNLLLRDSRGSSQHKKINRLSNSELKKCCFKQEDNACNNPVLPYTWHCKQHIMHNSDQLLFEHCTAKFSDNTQCSVPVFDVCHELPLCFEHAKKRDNYNKMASEPKQKKPRKKPKPSALTRPPKRGKKKKKPISLRPNSPSSPAVSLSNSIPMEMPNPAILTSTEVEKPVEPVVEATKPEEEPTVQPPPPHPELGSDLEDQFSPGAIEKSLELPLDTAELANQATKLLEEHDFTDVLNKIPDDAFNDLFVDTRNGDYIPSKEETEELERALAAVSKDVHLARESLAKLSSGTGPDLEELERSIEIHGSLLGADNLTSAIDENAFSELTNSHIDNLNVITSSFSTSDLNSLSQALAAEGLDHNHLSSVSDSQMIPTSIVSLPLIASDVSHPHLLNGHTTTLNGLPTLQLDANYASQLLESGIALNAVLPHGTSDARLVSNASLLSTVLFGIGQNATTSVPQTAFTTSLPGSHAAEDAGLISNAGGLSSTHWLLNSSDQVLALSHLGYQNGFLVSSQGVPYSSGVGKYPLQGLNTEVSLVSSDSTLVTSTGMHSESVICNPTEQSVHSLNHSNKPGPALQQTNSVPVIAQEGAS